MKVLLAEADYARRLSLATRELLEYSKGLGGLAERRAARVEFFAELAASGSIFLAPKAGDDPSKLYSVDADGVAHISIVGQLTPVAEQDVCGGYAASALTEYGYIVAATQAAENDQRVQSIDYHVNSPGGYVSGVEGAAQAMASAKIPTRAIIGDMAASAAYWLASQTDRIVATGSGSRVGSIGVLAEDFNPDRMLAEQGIDHRVFTSTAAPEKYADSNTEEGRAKIKADLDQLHDVFRSAVASGRGVSAETVDEKFGKGGVMTAQAALAAGMIDEIQGVTPRRQMKEQGGVAASAERPIKSKGKSMKTLEELKAENPDLYAQAVAVGREQGIKAERDRREELSHWTGPDMSEAVQAVAQEAISQGKTYAEVASQLSAAAARGPGAKAKVNDNPPKVASAEAPKTEADPEAVEGMSAADVKALMAGNPALGIKGMTIEEIRANAPKGGL